MLPIKYIGLGDEAYNFVISIDRSGHYLVNFGNYTDNPPREGTLSVSELKELNLAVNALNHACIKLMSKNARNASEILIIGEGINTSTYKLSKSLSEKNNSLNNLLQLLTKI